MSTSDKFDQGKKKAEKLLNSPRNQCISLINVGTRGKAFSIQRDSSKAVIYSGLTKKLKRIFYPETEEDPMKKKKLESDEFSTRATPYYSPKPERTCSTFGKEHGKLVHAEIYKFVACSTGLIDKPFAELSPDPDPCTLAIIDTVQKKGWVPIASEHMIWDEEALYGTAIDLLAIEKMTGKLILLELKNGYEDEIYDVHPTDAKLPGNPSFFFSSPFPLNFFQKKFRAVTRDHQLPAQSSRSAAALHVFDPPKEIQGHSRQIVYHPEAPKDEIDPIDPDARMVQRQG